MNKEGKIITKDELLKDLSALNINPSGTLLVHSSYKKIGNVEGRGDTVVDVLLDYMKEGTLILPTHTWDQIGIDKQPVMEVENTSSCIGILPEIFRHRPDVIRTWHPTHSVGIYGKKAHELAKGEELINTPCGPGSIWNKLLDERAAILLIGVNFTRNTFIHCIEELCDVPNRLTEELHDLYVITPNGEKLYTPQYRHRKGLGSETFWKLEDLMEKEGVLKKGRFGNAQTMLCDAQGLYRVLSQMLSKDIEILSDNEPLASFWYDMKFN